jgi:subtilisin family serine protease
VVGESRRDKVGTDETWHLEAAGLRAARKRGFTGTGQGVVVAVLDTGIEAEHEEIRGSVAEAYTFDVPNWRPVRSERPFDTHGHGTHVAGLIVGRNTGMAPGAKLVDGMMLRNGRGNLSDFLLAMEAVVQNIETPAQIVNMSAGLQGFLPEMAGTVAGIAAAGALPVFAVGNEGRNRTRSPGNFVDPISVGACRQDRKVASFSGSGTIIHENHQYTVPDLVAPGDKVYSCVRGGGYEAWSGTSMAAPIVSGVAALILEKHPLIQPADLIEELLAKCENLGVDAVRQGRGMVNCEPLL